MIIISLLRRDLRLFTYRYSQFVDGVIFVVVVDLTSQSYSKPFQFLPIYRETLVKYTQVNSIKPIQQ